MAGRKAHAPTEKGRNQVQAMAGYGMPQDQIAKVMQISETTLKKYYPDELSRGSAVANSLVAEQMFKQCMKGNATMLIWWSKTRMGWKETIHVNNTSSDGSMSPASDQSNWDKVHASLDRLAPKAD